MIKKNIKHLTSKVCLLIICCVFLVSCQWQMNLALKKLNADFNGEFKIGEVIEDSSDQRGFTYKPGWGVYDLISADELTKYTVNGYPDCQDDYRITYFSTADSKYRVWNIGVGSHLDEVRHTLRNHKLKELKDVFQPEKNVVFTWDGPFISFAFTNSTIIQMSISMGSSTCSVVF